MSTEQLTKQEARAFQQIFGLEGARTPAQQIVWKRLREAFQYDKLVFQKQDTLILGPEDRPVVASSAFDPLSAMRTDTMRACFIFIRERVETSAYTNELDA